MKIYLATSNQNKKREIQEIFSQHEIRTPADDGIEFDPEETGTTFYENSLIKAKALYEIVKCPVIADDSGICVDALNGAPGIYSSRYAGPEFMKGRRPRPESRGCVRWHRAKHLRRGVRVHPLP